MSIEISRETQNLLSSFERKRTLCVTSFVLSLLVAGAAAYLLYRGDIAHFKTRSFCIPGCVAAGVSLTFLVASVLLYRSAKASFDKALLAAAQDVPDDDELLAHIAGNDLNGVIRVLRERVTLNPTVMEALVTFYQRMPFDLNAMNPDLQRAFLTSCAEHLVEALPNWSFTNQREIIGIIFAHPQKEPLAMLTSASVELLEPYNQALVERIQRRDGFQVGDIRNLDIRQTIRQALR